MRGRCDLTFPILRELSTADLKPAARADLGLEAGRETARATRAPMRRRVSMRNADRNAAAGRPNNNKPAGRAPPQAAGVQDVGSETVAPTTASLRDRVVVRPGRTAGGGQPRDVPQATFALDDESQPVPSGDGKHCAGGVQVAAKLAPEQT